MRRLEEIAFHYQGNILWLAYRYSGAGKEEIVYTQGIDMGAKTSGPLYAEIIRVLGVYFQPKYDGSLGSLFGPQFLGCSQVYLDSTMPEGIKAVMQGYFVSNHVEVTEVIAPPQSDDEINARWAGPLGEPLSTELPGGVRVLSIMEAGITQKVTQCQSI